MKGAADLLIDLTELEVMRDTLNRKIKDLENELVALAPFKVGDRVVYKDWYNHQHRPESSVLKGVVIDVVFRRISGYTYFVRPTNNNFVPYKRRVPVKIQTLGSRGYIEKA